MRVINNLIATGLFTTLSMTASATGRIQGKVDGNAFEAAVECSFPMENMFQARTPGMGLSGSSSSKVIPAADIKAWGGGLVVTIFVAERRYQFGVAKFETPKGAMDYEGTIHSKQHGDYDVHFTLNCNP
jgi:hypothetical protein